MSASLDSTTPQTGQPSEGDWQEDVYQKIKAMKESYLPQLNEINQKIATKLHKRDSLPQDKFEKLRVFKTMLNRIITFLLVSKSNISLKYKERLDSYEKQIMKFIDINKPKQAIPPSLQQGQVTQVQSRENQMNSQLQANIQGSAATMQQSNMTSMQHILLSSVSAAQQSIELLSLARPPSMSGQTRKRTRTAQ